MAPTSKLGKLQQAGDSKESPASRLSQAIANGAIVGKPVTLPRLGDVYVQLVADSKANAINIAALKALQNEGIEQLDVNMFSLLIESERARRMLAVAVRDPDDHSQPFGTVEEWGALDTDLITACWHVYGDVAAELDPVVVELTPEQKQMITAAIAKKNSMVLRSFGTTALSSYMLSMDAPPAISAAPRLPSSEPSEDSSI